ncbi:MFS transporter [Jiangella sp. DSM 45060]|uniref:MFS transporter n=1 Tax=Jiangella sp. DSM 45060 TaxID=1798224 RepID=UPI00087B2196|nr:MFS transporter [Jiangella sp. DSM 45060]SDT64992.1 Fucose permease [Jiangella sp. DSM 45060]
MNQSAPAPSPDLARAVRARNAVATVFALNGLALASWMARIPEVRDLLGLTPGEIGRVLLALAVGSLIALPTSGFVVSKIGAARTVAGGSVLVALGLTLAGIGADTAGVVAVVAAGLVLFGYGSGSWDVAMNVEGAAVERLLGRTIMPRFHAAFSLGTVTGAGLSAGLAAVGVPVVAHLATVSIVAMIVTIIATRSFLPHAAEVEAEDGTPVEKISVLTAWREPRTLLIGLMVMCAALVEGIANDWLALGLVDGYEVSNTVGAIGFAIFLSAMTVGRMAGTQLVDRFGRLPVLRVSAVLAAGGVLLVVFGGSLWVALVGSIVWGFGAALGFPLGMSAGADDPRRAAARVSVIASVGYTAFLAGPPILGWLGDHEGVLNALLAVAVAATVLGLVSPAAREQRPARVEVGD